MTLYLRKIFIFTLPIIMIISACGKKTSSTGDQSVPDETLSTEDNLYYSWVDYLSIRENPGLDQPLITYLSQGEEVEFTGEVGSVQSTVTLRCVSYTAPWYQIKLNDGTEGWVFSAALSSEPVDMDYPHRLIVPYCGKNLKTASQEWKDQVSEIRSFIEERTDIPMKSIFFLDDKYTCLPIGDGDHPVSTITLSDYMKKSYGFDSGNGFFVVENGKTPRFIADGDSTEILLDMEDYFGIEIISGFMGIVAYITGETLPQLDSEYVPFYASTDQTGIAFVHVYELGQTEVELTNRLTNLSFSIKDYRSDRYGFKNKDGYFLIKDGSDVKYIQSQKNIGDVLSAMENYFGISVSGQYYAATNL